MYHKIISFARHLNGKTILVVANRDVNNTQSAKVSVPGLKENEKLENLVAPYGEKSYIQSEKNTLKVDLAPARIHIFEIDTPDIEKSGLKVYRQNLA